MRWLLTIVLAVVGGFAGAAAWDFSGFGGGATRDYLMAHPEVLPVAIDRYRLQQRQAQLAPVRAQLLTPFPGAVLGNPNGKVTLVEFSDYACTYCRASVADVQRLIAANPDLRVVVREYPILRPESVAAARMGLAAAEQGKYAAFHDAMYALGPPSEATIGQAAQQAGIDLAAANRAIATGLFDSFLKTNIALGGRIGIDGTPGWVVGDRILDGAVGLATLSDAVQEARQS
ncbi:MAG: thioredoxin domain-containing protein [Porphyrobacter sp.]|nr:thioredoxin domain-containing protein [Porphyrobacter sp.]